MTFTIPPKPSTFTPTGVAPGCERIPNLYPRERTGRRIDILVVHTNWGGGEGSIESAVRWALGAVGENTYAHYQHDRNGRAAKMLDSDRRGIGNSGTTAYWQQFGLPNASYRALVFETADRGTNTDPAPTGSYFTDAQMASLARDLAYECVVHGIPPVLLSRPDGRGIAGHCFPFPYPAFTTAQGKQCPGHRKYDSLTKTIIPWTAAIVAAWTAPPPPPVIDPDDPDEVGTAPEEIPIMLLVARNNGTVWVGDGVRRRPLGSSVELFALTAAARIGAVRIVTPTGAQTPDGNNVTNVWYHGHVADVSGEVLGALGAAV